VAAIAARQYGVITVRQLVASGMSSSAISRRVASGRFHRIHQGVYAVGHPGVSKEGRWLAAVLAAGDGAALAGRVAAAHWGISRFDVRVIDVLAPTRRRPIVGVHLRRSACLAERDVVVRDAIPVLDIHALVLDLGRDLSRWQLANVVHEAAFHRVLRREAIDALIDVRRHAKGMAVLRQALRLHDAGSAGTKSELEDEFLRIIIAARLPLPEVNVVVRTPGGRYRVDFLWRRRRLCIETDGRASHERKATRIDDEIRDEHLRAAGQRVERFTSRAVFNEPFAVARRLERLLS
jgi:very-short-patch-repair endonuclease